jgi:HEAT repeat protein
VAALKPVVWSAIRTDSDARVRRAAIIAAGNMDSRFDGTRNSAFEPEFRLWLIESYRSEPSALVRGEIVKDVALVDDGSASRRGLLLEALGDASDSVVQYAALGIGRSQIVEAVPTLVRLLEHPSAGVRMTAAKSLGELGALARVAEQELVARIAIEGNPAALATMKGALIAIRK